MKIEWHKVTWYSKLLTVIFFIVILPALIFYIEIQYQKTARTINVLPVISVAKNSALTPSTQKINCSLLPYTGTIPLSQTQYYFLGEEDLRGGMTCNFTINQKLPIFTFHFIGQEDNSLGNIEITEGDSKKVIQTITSTTSYGSTLSEAEKTLALVDTNFDGYQDLQILNNCGATGNCSYDFYIYNPIKNLFVRNSFLSGLGTPSFDETKKQITTSWNMSAYDWDSATYQWENSKYVRVKEIVSTGNGTGGFTKKTYMLKNGKMELTSSITN